MPLDFIPTDYWRLGGAWDPLPIAEADVASLRYAVALMRDEAPIPESRFSDR